jgi:hypothetical protein
VYFPVAITVRESDLHRLRDPSVILGGPLPSFLVADLEGRQDLRMVDNPHGGARLVTVWRSNLETALMVRPHLMQAMMNCDVLGLSTTEALWSGPLSVVLYHRGGKLVEDRYLHEKLSPEDTDLIFGAYTSKNLLQAPKWLWPLFTSFELSDCLVWPGCWNPSLEEWFSARMSSIRNRQPVKTFTEVQWRTEFNHHSYVKHECLRVDKLLRSPNSERLCRDLARISKTGFDHQFLWEIQEILEVYDEASVD